MTSNEIILLLFIILAVLFIFTFVRSRILIRKDLEMMDEELSKENDGDESPADSAKEEIDFSSELFRKAQEGCEVQVFMRIASNSDCYMIQSLLYSAGIPSYTEFEHVSGVFGNNSGILNSMFSSRLLILKDDYDEASVIAKEFIKNKVENLESNEKNSKLVDLLQIVCAPYPVSKKYTLLGLTLYPPKK